MAQLADDPIDMPLHRVFTQEEAEYDLGLSKWGVHIDTGIVDLPQSTFRCYLEDWEAKALKMNSASSTSTSLRISLIANMA
jgi:hypothetical protein